VSHEKGDKVERKNPKNKENVVTESKVAVHSQSFEENCAKLFHISHGPLRVKSHLTNITLVPRSTFCTTEWIEIFVLFFVVF
jgi:hypothetical protein